jgi:hypothetical protein
MSIVFKNNASTTIADALSSSAVEVVLASGTGALFPALTGSEYFYATIFNTANQIEIVKVTAVSGDTLTIIRGQESTTPRAYNPGDFFEQRITAAAMNAKLDADGSVAMTGPLTLPGVPTETDQAATMGYVQSEVAAVATGTVFTNCTAATTPAAQSGNLDLATTEYADNAALNPGGPVEIYDDTEDNATLWLRNPTSASGVNLKMSQNAGTKFLRVLGNVLQVLNDAYTAVLMSLDDGGNAVFNGTISGAVATTGAQMPTWEQTLGGMGTAANGLSGSRAVGVTYTNTQGKAIFVNASGPTAGGATPQFTLNGNAHLYGTAGAAGAKIGHGVVVPPGVTYEFTGPDSVSEWVEIY